MQKSTGGKGLPPAAWADWPFFLAAYRSGSLSAAAKVLKVEQSTVSRRVARLEEMLGHDLFYRGAGGLVPTEMAQLIAPQVERGESALLDGLTAASGHERQVEGLVRVACPESMAYLFLVPELPKLYAHYPGLEVELRTGYAVADLSRREADIGIRGVVPTDPDHVSKIAGRFTVGIFAHRSWIERGVPEHEIPWIGTSGIFESFMEGQWDLAIRRPPIMRSDSYLTRYAAAQSGLGCTLLPRPWGRQDEQLVELSLPPGAPEPPERIMYLVVHRALRRVPRIAATWAFLEESLQALNE
ncbi:MAG: LysR family transcriptional regulator [Bradymonadia bacterium]